MVRDILDKYCVLLKKEVYEEYSSYSLLVDLKHNLPLLKSEILLNNLNYENNKKEEYLNYIINEISNSTFDLNYDESNIKRWLEKYNISINRILNEHITHEPIYNKLNADYSKYDPFEDGEEKQYLFMLQDEFNKYFCALHANYIIEFCNQNKPSISSNNVSLNSLKMKDTYFDKFCELIDDYTILKKSTAIGVMIDLQLCIKEIKSETLLELQQQGVNRNDHLEFKINEVEKCNYDKNADINYIKKWFNEYQIGLDPILNNSFDGNPFEHILNTHYNDLEKSSLEKDKTYNAQLDFYQYFCRYYANELIAYFKSKMTNIESFIFETESENINQLSVNQAIILLDKLGVFNDKALENLSNVKKAKLISQLIGKNEKNIKTAIQKLELKPSEITPNYQKDIDKIERILENLE